ncbi:MAG: DoxX family protein [bacterium]|nr:DoxX family protein [bacterium]
MTLFQKISLVLFRLAMGWMFLYAGVTHLLNPKFSAAGYLASAKTLPIFFHWLASPDILPTVNFINIWGLTLLGVSLILGVCVRLSSALGVLLMILYWLPLGMLHPDAHSLIVDDHIIYATGLLALLTMNAGQTWGLDSWFTKLPFLRKHDFLHSFFE